MDAFDHFPAIAYEVVVDGRVEASYTYEPQFRSGGNRALRSAQAHAAFLNGTVKIGWPS